MIVYSRNKQARRVGLLMLLAALLAAAGCSAPVEEEQSAAVADLRIAVTVGPEAVPLIAALEAGFFAEAGVTVELLQVGERLCLNTALQSGAAHGALGNLFSLIELQEQGFLVMAASTSGEDYLLVAHSSAALEETEGLTAALSESLFELYLLETLLSRHEPKPAGVELLTTGSAALALSELLKAGADAALLPGRLEHDASAAGAVILASALAEGLPAGVIVFSGEALLEKEEALSQFYTGYLEAVTAVNRGRVDDLPLLLVEKWGYPETYLEQGLPELFAPRPVTREEVSDALAWYRTRKELAEGPAFESLVWRRQLGE